MHATATVFPLYWGAEQGWPCGYGTYLMVERRVSSCFTSLRCQVEMKILLPFLSSLFGLQISAPQSTWHSTSLTPQCPGSQLCRVALGPGGDPPTPPPNPQPVCRTSLCFLTAVPAASSSRANTCRWGRGSK